MYNLIGLLLTALFTETAHCNTTAVAPSEPRPPEKINGTKNPLFGCIGKNKTGPCNVKELVPFKLLPPKVKRAVSRWKWKNFTDGSCNIQIPNEVKQYKPPKYLDRVFEEAKKVCNAGYASEKGEAVEPGLEVVKTDNGEGVPPEALQPSIKEVKAKVDNDTGCNCISAKNWECVCCAWIFRWFFCQAIGLTKSTSLKLFFVTSVDDTVIFTFSKVLVDISKYTKWCTPLPPPVNLIGVCLKLKMTEIVAFKKYKLCAKFTLSFVLLPSLTLFNLCHTLDFTKIINPSRIGEETYEVTVSIDRQGGTGNSTLDAGEVMNDLVGRSLILYGSSRKIRSIKHQHHPDYKLPWVSDAVNVKGRVNWRTTQPGETPYLAVLYAHKKKPINKLDKKTLNEYPSFDKVVRKGETQKWMDSAHHHVFYPGGSCGGAVMSVNKILTNCGCIRTFYLRNKVKRKMEEIVQEGYDIQSDTIYFQIAEPKFNPEAVAYYLDKEPKHFMQDSLCVKGILANASQDYLEKQLMAMTFTPEIKDTRRQFMEWPPVTIEQLPQQAALTIVGLEPSDPLWNFVDDSTKEVNLEVTSVDYFLKKCQSHYCENIMNKALANLDAAMAKSIKEGTSCFCSRDGGIQVWSGEIGFPIIAEDRVVGLSTTGVDGEGEGGVLGTFFDAKSIEEIGKYIGSAPTIGDKVIFRIIHVLLPCFLFSFL